jgi:HAE1 family hydrophobic/amphiphilic exporter-1
MHLIELFIRNPVKVSVGVLLVTLFGTIALVKMPVELTPRVERPRMTVRARWNGAGPQEIEHEIVTKLEELLNDLPGMTEMTSQCRESQGYISMEFSVGTNMSDVLVHITNRLGQIRDYPEDADEPIIYTSDNSRSPIARFNLIIRPPDPELIVEYQARHPELADVLETVHVGTNPALAREKLEALIGEHPELAPLMPPHVDVDKLTLFAKQTIADQLTRVTGVSYVWIWGGQKPEMQVIIDPFELAGRQLTISDIRQALRNENQDTPGGDLQQGDEHFVVRTMGRYTSPEQVADEILGVHDGAAVYVRDVADVRLGYKRGREGAWQFGSPSLSIGVTKSPGANLFDVMEGVKRVRDELNGGVLRQRGVYLHQTADSTIYVESALGLVKKNILLGGFFTVVILLVFLRDARSTLVVALAIPVSIVGTFLMLGLLGRSLNVISLAGMAFAVGMLVDNAVVVLENIVRHHQRGEDPVTAAIQGTTEVWGATLASTLTTAAVFIPTLFVQEEAGQLFADIALAISCGVGLSLLVSVTVIPTAACRLLSRQNGSRSSRIQWLRPLDRLASKFVSGVVGINEWLLTSTLLRIAVIVVFFGGALLLTFLLTPPIEYLPKGNRNLISGSVYPPPGYSVDRMLRIGQQFHQALRPFVDGVSPESGSAPFTGPRVADLGYGTYGGSIWMSARATDPRRTSELLPIMRKIASDITADDPDIDISINQAGLFESGWNRAGRSIDIDIRGPELTRLVELGRQIREMSREKIPGATVTARPSLNLSAPQIQVVPRKFEAAEMGMTSTELGYNVSALVDGAYATGYFYEGTEIDLTIVAHENISIKEQDLPVAIPDGKIVPLSAIADIVVRTGPPQIAHVERSRAITISVVPPDEMALGEAIDIVDQEVFQPLKENGDLQGLYTITMSGTADKLRATWQALRFNFLIVLLITYLLMAALFESWLYPFVIMVSVPLAGVGGLIGLKLMNLFVLQQLDILTMLGFIILVGTVVNNAILIVHQSLNHMRVDNLTPQQAIVTSVRNRVRPIFMTTFTTTFGLLPLVLFPGAGSELYRGVGSVVLGGLIVSTLFTMFLVPCLFSLTLEAKAEILRLWFGALTRPALPAIPPNVEELESGVR